MTHGAAKAFTRETGGKHMFGLLWGFEMKGSGQTRAGQMFYFDHP
jgi:hypothetical protein